MKWNCVLTVGLVCMVGGFLKAHGQTTLSGNHIINGDLTVGTSANSSKLEVIGEAGNSAGPGIKVTGDGGAVFEGQIGVGPIPAEGEAVRMMWYPSKAAFRAGFTDGYTWSAQNIGNLSAAFGENNQALGNYSFLAGKDNFADGGGATAFGQGNYVNGNYAFAGGLANQVSDWGVAFGYGNIVGFASIAVGDQSMAMYESVALGNNARALGDYSVALSRGYAEGELSFAFGENAQALGRYSVALPGSVAYGERAVASGWGTGVQGNHAFGFGDFLIVDSYSSFVVGRWNRGGGNLTTWVESDPLFEVGNGTGDYDNDPPEVASRSAFTVFKNGKIKMDRQGDILMGEFGNPE